jgi:hypothetical protein
MTDWFEIEVKAVHIERTINYGEHHSFYILLATQIVMANEVAPSRCRSDVTYIERNYPSGFNFRVGSIVFNKFGSTAPIPHNINSSHIKSYSHMLFRLPEFE